MVIGLKPFILANFSIADGDFAHFYIVSLSNYLTTAEACDATAKQVLGQAKATAVLHTRNDYVYDLLRCSL